MSNIFITDIVGTIGIPSDDTELAAATATLDGLLGPILDLTYDRVLAWVEDSGGPDGAEGVRTLNCLIEKFTYLGEECPSEALVDTLSATIETTLEGGSISSIGVQQYHLVQVTAYALWSRDTSGGFLYPTTATDDVVVGPPGAPTGKWFDDGDLVLGGNTMAGTEKIRVVGSARIEGNLTMTGLLDDPTGLVLEEQSSTPYDPTATSQGTLWVRDDNPNVLVFTDNAGTDTVLGSGGTSLWTSAAGVIYPTTLTDVVGVGKTTGTGFGELMFVTDDEETGSGSTFVVELEKNDVGTRPSWIGVRSFAAHSGTGDGTTYEAMHGEIALTGAATLTTGYCYFADFRVSNAGGQITTMYGYYLDTPTLVGTLVNAYGVYISALGATTNSYGVYQAGADDLNYFAGVVAINATAAPGAEQLYILDDDETAAVIGASAHLVKDSTGTKASWYGFAADIDHTGAGDGTLYAGFGFTPTINNATPTIVDLLGYVSSMTITDGSVTRAKGFLASVVVDGAVDEYYGIHLDVSSGSGSTAFSCGICVSDQGTTTVDTIGILVEPQSGSNSSYGVFQDGASNYNYFGGNTQVGGLAIPLTDWTLYVSNVSDTGNQIAVEAGLNKTAAGTMASFDCYSTAVTVLGGTVTTVKGIDVDSPTGNGTITTIYGVHISNQKNGPAAAAAAWGVYQDGLTDLNYFAGKVGINETALTTAMLEVQDADQTNSSWGGLFRLTKDGAGAKSSWTGVEAQADHSEEEDAGTYMGFMADLNFTAVNSTLSVAYGFRTQLEIQESTSECTTWYGLRVQSNPGSGDITNAYGVYIDNQSGITDSYGIYQDGDDDNYFAGRVGIGAIPATSTKFYVQATDFDSLGRGAWVHFGKTAAFGQNGFLGVRSSMTYTGNQAPSSCYGFASEYDFSPSGAQTMTGLYGYTSAHTTGANATVTSLVNFYAGSDDLDGTIGNLYGFRAGAPSISGAVTNAYAFYAEDQGGGVATNAYGVYIADQDGATLSYGIYQAGTDDLNYFAGYIGVNTTPSSTRYISVEDTEDASAKDGVLVTISKSGASAKLSSHSFNSLINHTGTGTGATYTSYGATTTVNNASALVSTVYGVLSTLYATNGTVTDYYGLRSGSSVTGGTITNAYGLYIGSMSGTTISYGIYQADSADSNYFAGNIGVNDIPTDSNYIQIEDTEDLSTRSGVLVKLTKDGSSSKVNHYSFESVINHTGAGTGADYRGLDVDIAVNNALATISRLAGVNIDLNQAAGSITNNYGVYISMSYAGSGIGTNYGIYIDSSTMTSNTFGIYQINQYDVNYFNGKIGVGTNNPATSAAIEISSTTRALLISRMTAAQRGALTAANGMIVYQTDAPSGFYFYENGSWVTGSGLV